MQWGKLASGWELMISLGENGVDKSKSDQFHIFILWCHFCFSAKQQEHRHKISCLLGLKG